MVFDSAIARSVSVCAAEFETEKKGKALLGNTT